MSEDLTPRFPGGRRRYTQFMAFFDRYSRPIVIAWLSATALGYLFAFLIQDFSRNTPVADGPRAGGPPPTAIMDAGQAAYKAGDHRRARDILLPLAEVGHRDAQFLVGETYANTRAGRPDYCEAAKWFDRAARQGDPWAQGRLARAYKEGEGIPADPEKAYLWARYANQLNDRAVTTSALAALAGQLPDRDRKRLDTEFTAWDPGREPPARIIRIPNIPFLDDASRRVIGVAPCRPWIW